MTQFDRFKAQMALLVPMVRAMREEFGEAAADRLVTRVLDDVNRAHGARIATRAGDVTVDMLARGIAAFAADDALDYEVVEQDDQRFDFNVRRCRYMEHMEAIGARDLGPMLVCRSDIPAAEGLGVGFERRQTIMQGAPCCDFRYRLRD